MGSDVAECKATGLGCISPTPPNTTGVHDPASLWGYNVGDEPGLIQFAQHAALFKTIRQLRPGSMGFANLLESYCPSGPSFAYSLPVHSFHTRRDRVASLTTCRSHGAAIQRASPLGPGRALTLPCGWNNAGGRGGGAGA